MDTFYAAAAPYVHGFYIAYAQSARAGRRGRRPRPSGHRRAETGTRGHRAEPRRAVGPGPGARGHAVAGTSGALESWSLDVR